MLIICQRILFRLYCYHSWAFSYKIICHHYYRHHHHHFHHHHSHTTTTIIIIIIIIISLCHHSHVPGLVYDLLFSLCNYPLPVHFSIHLSVLVA